MIPVMRIDGFGRRWSKGIVFFVGAELRKDRIDVVGSRSNDKAFVGVIAVLLTSKGRTRSTDAIVVVRSIHQGRRSMAVNGSKRNEWVVEAARFMRIFTRVNKERKAKINVVRRCNKKQ
jgi:hypothetical protein